MGEEGGGVSGQASPVFWPRARKPVTTGMVRRGPSWGASAAAIFSKVGSYSTSALVKSSVEVSPRSQASYCCAKRPSALRKAANMRVERRSPNDARLSRARGVKSCRHRSHASAAVVC